MNSKGILAIGFALGLTVAVSAHATAKLTQDVRVLDPNHTHLKLLSQNPELVIDHVSSAGYEVYGPEGLRTYLESVNVPYYEAKAPVVSRGADYPSPEDSTKAVQALAARFPNLITLIEIGKSVEGRSLTFARVTAPDGQGTPLANRPEFKYIANMHGDEIIGRDMMVKLIEDLASNYGTDSRITTILNTTQVYILNSMNPDGAFHKTRANAHGTDLNRSFPDFTTSDNQNTSNGREPEIQAVMKFQAAHHFKLSANFHGGSQVVNYPWDTQAALFPLDNLVQKLSLDYAKRVPYIYNSTEFTHGITNGYAWYEVDGGMQDWSYNWYKDLQLTIELTTTKWPAYSTLSTTYGENRDALLALIEDIYQF
jgi:uncharacterized protein YeaC (DUF1315 family)